ARGLARQRMASVYFQDFVRHHLGPPHLLGFFFCPHSSHLSVTPGPRPLVPAPTPPSSHTMKARKSERIMKGPVDIFVCACPCVSVNLLPLRPGHDVALGLVDGRGLVAPAEVLRQF